LFYLENKDNDNLQNDKNFHTEIFIPTKRL